MLTLLLVKIDFEDFKAYASRKEDTIAKSFAQLDVDHNGSISVNDLVRLSFQRCICHVIKDMARL